MAGVLAAEDRVRLCHGLLDERVPDPSSDRCSTVLTDDLWYGPGRDQVVHDRRAWCPIQLSDRDQCGQSRRCNRLAALVDDETAVGVAVERQADVGTVLDHGSLQVAQILRLDRVCFVVGEGAVELEVERDHPQARNVEYRGNGVPGHSVGRVDHDSQRPHLGQVHEPAQILGVVGQHVTVLLRAWCVGRRRTRPPPPTRGSARARCPGRPAQRPRGTT